jgi:20S proteasome subunit alpha 3
MLICTVEFATVGRTKSGKIYHHLWSADEIDALLKEHGLAKQEDTDMSEQ